MSSSSASRGLEDDGEDSGQYSSLTIPSSYVGWIKGKQGAMVREIEAKSGAIVDIDQSCKELGHVVVNFRGSEEVKKKAFGFVVAEVVKVSDQGGGKYDCSSFGTKTEIRIEGKYVGWVKGPRGKVVQDISTRSNTRIDMDQTSDAFAIVRVYGTFEGVENAKEFLAYELSKVSPEAAAEITGGRVFDTFQAPPPQSAAPAFVVGRPRQQHQSQQQTHLLQPLQQQQQSLSRLVPVLAAPSVAALPTGDGTLTGLLATLAGALASQPPSLDPMVSTQQAAAAQLTQSYLQQLSMVAPSLLQPRG
mmetsp:Transcript_40891/g.117467  ORF Transcript_40891/g.117467 Transcript_40891/m.117467 type:complete len:304 (-) Transcript_40891:11-922(-)